MIIKIAPLLLAPVILSSVRSEKVMESQPPSFGPLSRMLAGLMKIMGYDERSLGNIAVDMMMYVGELTANSLFDEDNNIATELRQYRSLSSSADIFSLLQLAVTRSTTRGEEIKSALLGKELTGGMIERLEEVTGERTSCIQMFLCKMSPVIAAVQQSSATAFSEIFGNSLEQTGNLLMDLVYETLPDLETFEKESRECEAKYSTCKLLSFGTKT